MVTCCRICLTKKVQKDVSELQSIPEIDRNHLDVMWFCLDIQVPGNPQLSRSLCTKCYEKVITFYIFKLQALKNDAFLRSLLNEKVNNYNRHIQTNNLVKILKTEIGPEIETVYDDFKLDIKDDPNDLMLDIKAEDTETSKSDNKVLSDLKRKKKKSTKDENRKAEEQIKITSDNKIKQPPQVCEQCGKSVTNLKEHMERHKDPADRKQFPCKNCSKIFNTSDGRYQHNKRNHLKSLSAECTVCNKTYANLPLHTIRMHNREMFRVECRICKQRFPNQSTHDHHFRCHTDEKPYKCDVCNGTFRTNGILASHKRGVHDKERPYLCHLCPNSYASKRPLQIHLRVHTNEWPFTCDECGKQFRSRSLLKLHLVKHTGVKSVACPICDKKFYTANDRNHHMKYHKEKCHPCECCGALFTRPDHRGRHERNIHGHDRNVHGHDRNIHGHDRNIHGHDRNIHGHERNIHGHDSNIHGHERNIHGHERNIHGHDSNIHGHERNMHGHDRRRGLGGSSTPPHHLNPSDQS